MQVAVSVYLLQSCATPVPCRELDLSNNTISEIGEGLPRMAALQVLRLENNRIDALPDNIGSCKALVKLDLSTNNLHSLPDSMGQFRKLQRLSVANNMLRRVPASMGGLKTLKELDLRCCPDSLAAEVQAVLLQCLGIQQPGQCLHLRQAFQSSSCLWGPFS